MVAEVQKKGRSEVLSFTFCEGRLKSIFLNGENAACKAAHQLRAQRSGSQLGRRNKGAGG